MTQADGAISRLRVKTEVAVVLLAIWLPLMLASLASYLGQVPSGGPASTLGVAYQFAARGGECLILLLLMMLSGLPKAEFGLTRFRLRDLGIGLGVTLWMLVTAATYTWSIQGLNWSYRTAGRTEAYVNGVWLLPIVFIGVLFEELFFRSFLQTRLRNLGWRARAIIPSTAALFAAPHIYQGPAVLPFVFLFGLVLGAMRLKLRSLWPGFVAHLLYDVVVIGFPIVWSMSHGPR